MKLFYNTHFSRHSFKHFHQRPESGLNVCLDQALKVCLHQNDWNPFLSTSANHRKQTIPLFNGIAPNAKYMQPRMRWKDHEWWVRIWKETIVTCMKVLVKPVFSWETPRKTSVRAAYSPAWTSRIQFRSDTAKPN